MVTRWLECEHLHHETGFLSPGFVAIDASGFIRDVRASAPTDPVLERVTGYVLPGMPNLHGHAFQRAMAGFAEHATRGQSDSFWSWRERMYDVALRVTPSELRAIAAQVYVEMLEAGMTSAA